MENPCKTCTWVKDPRNCENKHCQEWQQWFIDMWDMLREQSKYWRKEDGK